MRIAAIVVTYNRKTLLEECVQALIKHADSADVLIIDNASTDGTGDSIANYVDEKSVYYFNTGSNIGGAGGFNYGIRKAFELGYDYFWLMDDDTIVTEKSLSALLEADRRLSSDYGFLSSMAYWTDGEVCLMNHHIINREWNNSKKALKEGLVRIDAATFVSFLVKRETVQEIGLPIKDYFIWGDDTEYSMRISNYKPSYLVYNSEVVHKMKSNANAGNLADQTDVQRIDRAFYSFRNDGCTAKKQGIYPYVKYTLLTYRNIPLILKSDKPKKIKKIKTVIKGYVAGLLFNPEVEKLTNN